jgi:hypothetical protein
MPKNIAEVATSQGRFEDDALHIIAQKQMVRCVMLYRFLIE